MKSSSIDKLGWSELEILFEHCTEAGEDEREKICPLGGVNGSFERSFHLQVEMFNHSFGAWMVCCHMYPFGAEKVGEGCKEGGFKLCTVIGCNSGKDTNCRHPMSSKGTGDGFGHYVRNENCLWPSCILIDTGGEIMVIL